MPPAGHARTARVTGRLPASGKGSLRGASGVLPGAQPSQTPSLISVRPDSSLASRQAWMRRGRMRKYW